MAKKSMAIVEALAKIRTSKHAFSLHKDVAITSLDADLTTVTEFFAFWAMEHERLNSKVSQKELAIKRLRARLDLRIRKKMASGEMDKLTEAGVNNKIILNKEYQKMEDELYALKDTANKLQVARQALMMKKDALQSIAANRRKELDDKGLTVKTKAKTKKR